KPSALDFLLSPSSKGFSVPDASLVPLNRKVTLYGFSRPGGARIAGLYDHSNLQDRVSVGQRQSKPDILLYEYDGRPTGASLLGQDVLKTCYHCGLKAFGDLVDQDQTRPRQ